MNISDIFYVLVIIVILNIINCNKNKKFVSNNIKINNITNNTIKFNEIQLNITSITWNLAEKPPSISDCKFLKELGTYSDILAIGVQECEDIKLRRNEGRRSIHWRNMQLKYLNKEFKCITQHKMGGLQLSIYVKDNISSIIEGYQVLDVACGIGNVLTNKGAICVILRLFNKSVAFVNAHLAAHQNKIKERNNDYTRIMNTIIRKTQSKWLKKSYLKYKKYLISQSTENSSKFTSKLFESSKPFIGQVFSAVGMGSSTDITTAISDKRKYEFNQLSDNGLSEISNIKIPVIKTFKKSKSNQNKLHIPVYEGKYNNHRKNKWKNKLLKSKDVKSINKMKNYLCKNADCPFDSMLFMGDLNYRVDLPRLEIEIFKELLFPNDKHKKKSKSKKDKNVVTNRLSIINSPLFHNISKSDLIANPTYKQFQYKLQLLLNHDQLLKQIYEHKAFYGFYESNIQFIPSFKYDKNSNSFDSSSKSRQPAWTDRILYSYSHNNNISILVNEYDCLDVRHSDHRPVYARFSVVLPLS